MPLVYSVISRGSSVIIDCQVEDGDFRRISKVILERISKTSATRKSYVHEGYSFNYIVDDENVFMVIADTDFATSNCFAYLNDLQAAYEANSTDISLLRAEMKKLMDRYSQPGADRLRTVKEQVENVKGIMRENIEKVLARGEKIEDVLDRSESLGQGAELFRQRATRLQRQMWWKNKKIIGVMVAVVLIVLLFILFASCGITLSHC